MKRVILKETKKDICVKAKVAETFYQRLMGLMFLTDMNGFDGLIIRPCQSVHNFFVKFSTDVIFVKDNGEIVKIIRNFKPWRISGYYFRAKYVIETKANYVPLDLKEGDMLEIINV